MNRVVPIVRMLKRKLFKYVAKLSPGYGFRIWLLRKCNYEIGEKVFIGEDFIIVDDLKDETNYVIIEDRVAISPRVTFVVHTKPNWSRIADYVNSKKGSIIVRKDAWIGTGAVLLPDVEVGEGAVVGANCVVTRNVAPYTVVGGIPAKEIRKVDVPWRSGDHAV
jgi:acetyltransferase-like isoleucine patch superfamily enzyme